MPANLLKDSNRAGVYHWPASRRHELRDMVGKAGLLLLTADLGASRGIDEVLADLGKALHFPLWYGANLDALNDCLSDPAWHAGRGMVILISGLEALRRSDPASFPRLLEVLVAASRSRALGQAPLWILLTTPAPGLAALPEV